MIEEQDGAGMINDGTLAAFARLVVTLVVSVAAVAGYALDSGLIYNIVFSALALACILWSWWKNNNVTKDAQQAQLYLNELKRGPLDSGVS